MKASESSTTAEQMAFSRAIESRKSSAERICYDPFAEQLLGARYKAGLFTRFLRDGIEKLIEARFAGHHYYVIARTRYIDDFLQDQLLEAVQQVVILGAGFDSRAYRFSDQLGNVVVFEVDHPATSAEKQVKVHRALASAKNSVVYVPVDFNTEVLAEELRNHGYQDDSRTVFLWEGVTPYLSADAVDDVLQFVLSSSGSGSLLIFDYVVKSILEGSCDMRGARNEFEKMNRGNEPLVFGIEEGEAGAFLSARGFRDVVDVGSAELTERYFANNPGRYIKPWWRLVHATVP